MGLRPKTKYFSEKQSQYLIYIITCVHVSHEVPFNFYFVFTRCESINGGQPTLRTEHAPRLSISLHICFIINFIFYNSIFKWDTISLPFLSRLLISMLFQFFRAKKTQISLWPTTTFDLLCATIKFKIHTGN